MHVSGDPTAMSATASYGPMDKHSVMRVASVVAAFERGNVLGSLRRRTPTATIEEVPGPSTDLFAHREEFDGPCRRRSDAEPDPVLDRLRGVESPP